jgi:hypothetical protein
MSRYLFGEHVGSNLDDAPDSAGKRNCLFQMRECITARRFIITDIMGRQMRIASCDKLVVWVDSQKIRCQSTGGIDSQERLIRLNGSRSVNRGCNVH